MRYVTISDVNKDWTHNDQDKDKDWTFKDKDKDKDWTHKDQDKDKDLTHKDKDKDKDLHHRHLQGLTRTCTIIKIETVYLNQYDHYRYLVITAEYH